MIPKTIHYCWFGRGEKPKLAQKCIASWRKFCPDYEIIEWNEDNFDVNLNEYTRFTYENKLYAYLSDYVRLWAVEKMGGLYFDTDVELIRSPDSLLEYEAFFCFETKEFITSGLGFGSIPHHPATVAMARAYESKTRSELQESFDEYHNLTGSPRMNTYAMLPYGLKQSGQRQSVLGAEILPMEYMCPYNDITGELTITPNTYSIHWYLKSAHGKSALIKSKFARPIRRLLKNVFHVSRWDN